MKGKAIASMVCGILSICDCYGWGTGIIFAIVALVLSKQVFENAAAATEADQKFAKAGKITGTIGLILSILGLIGCIICAACGACAMAAGGYY